MTDLQYTILESSNSGLISVSEASQMISMMYESDSVMAKIKNAWESLKKWVKSVVKKLIEKVTGIKIKEKKKVKFFYKRRNIDVENRKNYTEKTFTVSPYALI